jgi:hypothetical protein
MGIENSPHRALEIPVTNSGPDKLNATVKISGAPSEVLPHRLSGFGAGVGTTVFMISTIKRKRQKPIYIRIAWQRGSESGVQRFVIAPDANNSIRH